MLKPSSTRIALLVALCGLCRAAQLQWGNTTLTGQDTPILNQEFFGGMWEEPLLFGTFNNLVIRYPVCPGSYWRAPTATSRTKVVTQ